MTGHHSRRPAPATRPDPTTVPGPTAGPGPATTAHEATGAIGPHAVEVGPHAIRAGDGWAATLIVTGYPAHVGPAWLDPVLAVPARLDAAVHIHPLPAPAAAAGIRRSRARLEATRRLDADHGRLDDPTTGVTATDADDLARRLARGEVRLFRVGVYLTVHAPTHQRLREAVAQVRASAAAAMLDTQPATWRHLAGWTTTLPLGHDGLRQTRVMDTDALALAFPLTSADLPAPLPGRPDPPGGILIGVNPDTAGIVWWDRWTCDNHNTLVLARSGAGKSYLVKLDILRSLYAGVQVAVIDPEDEYPPLAAAVGGTTITLGAPGVRVNPLDLPLIAPPSAPRSSAKAGPARTAATDVVSRRAMFVHTLVAVLLGGQAPPDERAALDTALAAAYRRAGITSDPATWTRAAPTLPDVAAELQGNGDDPAARSLAVRLRPWTHGSFKNLFDGPTTTRPSGRLVVWSVRHLPDELRAAGMLLALDAIWRNVDATTTDTGADDSATSDATTVDDQVAANTTRSGPVTPRPRPVRRLVVVDEAWTLLRETDGARFLNRMAKAARKRRAGLVVVTQDAADLLDSDLGQAVAANAATQILMRQAPQAIPAITRAFDLTETEARLLTSAPRGQGLLIGGSHRVTFRAVASDREHRLCHGPGETGADPAAPAGDGTPTGGRPGQGGRGDGLRADAGR